MKHIYRDYTKKTIFNLEPLRFNYKKLFISIISGIVGSVILYWLIWR